MADAAHNSEDTKIAAAIRDIHDKFPLIILHIKVISYWPVTIGPLTRSHY